MKITEEQKLLLEMITEELNGKLQFWYCSDKHKEHQKIVIEYGHSKKTND